jgi:hypothetical protein
MKLRAVMIMPLALVAALVVSRVVSPLGVRAASGDDQNGSLHLIKTCPAYLEAHGAAGSFCTISSSNVPQIPVGTTVYYDQAAGAPVGTGVPTGFLDSNVLLYVSPGDWAVGRCTIDWSTFTGLCTFSNGVGPLAGFRARIEASPAGGVDFHWDGTYNVGGQ